MSRPYQLTHLDLFSGIGGFALAAKWAGFRTVRFCEIEPYAQRVLAKNFGAYVADSAQLHVNGSGADPEPGSRQIPEPRERSGACRIWPDIRELRGADIGCNVTLLTGGFPCQPFSCAGKRRGTADDRHLWPEMLRVISEARPTWVLGENVAGFADMVEWDRVLEVDSEGIAQGEIGDVVNRLGRGIADEAVEALEAIGYTVRPFWVPACATDAKHRRMRVWIVAYLPGARLEGVQGRGNRSPDGRCYVPDTNKPRPQGWNSGVVRERSSERIVRSSGASLADTKSFGSGSRCSSESQHESGRTLTDGYWASFILVSTASPTSRNWTAHKALPFRSLCR